MSKIKIKNFGPIKEGYLENDGWMDIEKVAIFIGNQGSGKSTVAKLIATFMWLEKAMIRGDVNTNITANDFIEMLAYHRMEEYLQADSVIEYEGAFYQISLQSSGEHGKRSIAGKKNGVYGAAISLPKIMYVPAERNFLSSIKDTNKISNLLAGSLSEFAVEYRRAQLDSGGKPVNLPINNAQINYDEDKDEVILTVNNKPLKLSSAASGFHSIVPLYWVSQNLINFIHQDEKTLLRTLSTDQIIRRERELKQLNQGGVIESVNKEKESRINSKFICRHFVNIVEEPELNLFPTSQQKILNSLLAFNNMDAENKLIITTHSPYLINYLTLAVEANKLKGKVNTDELKKRLNDIVPLNATLDGSNLVVYQLDEKKGTITMLKTYKGLPSDENYLNEGLAESNEQFSNLLEIEDLCR